MRRTSLGIVHPGSMGISVAATMQNSGGSVYWASHGRSAQTTMRALEHGLIDTGTLDKLCELSTTIVSVCPPHVAEEVASQVVAAGFQGIYLDANAISQERTKRIGDQVTAAGCRYVDGGIIGGPAWQPGRTWLHLSGPDAEEVARYFAAGPLETNVVGAEIGQASALKMCFAAYTKGTTALLCAVLSTADALGVRNELELQWSRQDPDFPEQTHERVCRVTAKAWRFAGEMNEIADTFAHAGVPQGFSHAAELYDRLAYFKDVAETPDLQDVLQAIRSELDSGN